jgi:hypothetical protein
MHRTKSHDFDEDIPFGRFLTIDCCWYFCYERRRRLLCLLEALWVYRSVSSNEYSRSRPTLERPTPEYDQEKYKRRRSK